MKRATGCDRVGILGIAVMVAMGVSLARAESEKSEPNRVKKSIAMNELPGAVRAAAEKAIAGGTTKRVVAETHDGRNVYAIEARTAGKSREFTYASDGTLLAEEEDIAFSQLPEPVRVAAEKYFGGSRGLQASRETAKGATSYEVEGRKGREKMSLELSPAGAVLKEEKDED